MNGPNHLSILGIIHTAISIIALVVALLALVADGRVDPAKTLGKWYVWLTVLTCVTGFPIMKTGHFTPGHYLSIIIVILLPLGIYAHRIFGKAGDYLQVIFISTTVFLSFIPAVVETLTRLPISAPLASEPNDPIIQKAFGGLILIFVLGVIYQLVKLRTAKKAAV